MARSDGTYSRLYDHVEKRLLDNGGAMEVSKEAFCLASDMPPGVFDVAKVAQADNYTFFQVAFLCLLCSLPNKRDYELWREYFETMPPDQFRTKVLRMVLNRSAASNRLAKVVNGEEYVET